MRSNEPESAKTVKILHGVDHLRRVRVVERSDGAYAVEAEQWYQNVFGGKLIVEGWKGISSESGLFSSVELAEQEAIVRFDWLRESLCPK